MAFGKLASINIGAASSLAAAAAERSQNGLTNH